MSPPRLLLIFSLWLTLLVLSKPVWAGNYTVVYSANGSAAIVDYGRSSSRPYYIYGGNQAMTAMVHWPPPYSGSANAQSQITATFTWHSTGLNDAPPASVILKEDSLASWGYTGQYDTGSCADGFGDPEVPTMTGGSSSGSRYSVQQNPGSSFSITCTPTAQVAGSQPESGSGTIVITYQATATPVTVIVSGLTNSTNVLIGQKLSASLSTGIYPQSNWQWSVAGADPFAGFQVTATTGQALELTDAMKQQANFSYFYRSLGGGRGPIQSTITCSATITDSKGAQHQVTGTEQVNVYQPDYTKLRYTGSVIVPAGNALLWATGDPMYDNGFTLVGTVTTPGQFIGEEGKGIWGVAQLIQVGGSYTMNYGLTPVLDPQSVPPSVSKGLDVQFTYDGQLFPADGTSNIMFDSPHYPIRSGMTTVTMSHKFWTYMLYQPPDATGAAGTTWVPLHEIDWAANGTAQLSAVTNTWTVSGTGVTISNDTPVSTLPMWTQVIVLKVY